MAKRVKKIKPDALSNEEWGKYFSNDELEYLNDFLHDVGWVPSSIPFDDIGFVTVYGHANKATQLLLWDATIAKFRHIQLGGHEGQPMQFSNRDEGKDLPETRDFRVIKEFELSDSVMEKFTQQLNKVIQKIIDYEVELHGSPKKDANDDEPQGKTSEPAEKSATKRSRKKTDSDPTTGAEKQ